MTSDLTPPSGGTDAVRVDRTGIALVHEGEVVLPAAGSEAAAGRVAEDARTTIAYYFPVEVEVRATGSDVDAESIASLALTKLAAFLENG